MTNTSVSDASYAFQTGNVSEFLSHLPNIKLDKYSFLDILERLRRGDKIEAQEKMIKILKRKKF